MFGKINPLIREKYSIDSYESLKTNPKFMSIFNVGEVRPRVKILKHTERSDCNKEVIIIPSEEVTIDMELDQQKVLKK